MTVGAIQDYNHMNSVVREPPQIHNIFNEDFASVGPQASKQPSSPTTTLA